MNAEPQIIDEPGTTIVPMDLMQRAITSGADVVVLEKLMGLQERWEANQARRAFEAALADAKAEIPTIEKTRQVDFTTNRGRTRYKYEDFATVADTIAPFLSKHGLSYRHRSAQTPELLTVTCIIAHREGHSEETTLSAPVDMSGNKNPAQGVGSTATYLQRYTLKLALGLAAAEDDDAQAGATSPRPRPENEDEYARRWQDIFNTATDDVELENQWMKEADLRLAIIWRRPGRPQSIYEAMRRKQEELIAAEEKREADLQTQRLEAQDS